MKHLHTGLTLLFLFTSPLSACLKEIWELLHDPTPMYETPPQTPCIYNQKTITSIREAEQDLLEADQNSLVVFDIDETLLEPSDPTFQLRFNTLTNFDERSRHPRLRFVKAPNFSLKLHHQLIEYRTAELIQELQKKKVPTIALSAFSGGSYESIPDLHDYRHQKLILNGINFDQPLPIDQNKFNNVLNPPYVQLKHGIVSSWFESKEEVLSLFINCMHKKPRNVIFIDDNKKNFSDLEAYMTATHVATVTAYLYKGAYHGSKQRPDLQVVEKQCELMARKQDYVSYDEAEKTIASQSAPSETERIATESPRIRTQAQSSGSFSETLKPIALQSVPDETEPTTTEMPQAPREPVSQPSYEQAHSPNISAPYQPYASV